MNEDALLRWLRRQLPEGGLIGDDAALLPRKERWAVTMDTQIEGVHFLPGLDPAQIARRLLAVNLSDLAAMGAQPAYAFLSLTSSPAFSHRRFFRAFLSECKHFGIELAGGDLSGHDRVSAVLTLLGSRRPKGRWLERGAAAPDQVVWVGGTLGMAAAGLRLLTAGARWEGRRIVLPSDFESRNTVGRLARRAVQRHLAPLPQLELSSFLAVETKTGAAIDLSDGLARDAHRLAQESELGLEIVAEKLPLEPHFAELADRLGCRALDLVLGGGEDYVLLFTLPGRVLPPSHWGCRAIGRTVTGSGVFLLQEGKRQPLPPLGWDHLPAPKAK